MPTVSEQADLTRDGTDADLNSLGGDLFHAVLGLGLLPVILVLNVFKPPGLTPYGWRKQNEGRREQSGTEAQVLRGTRAPSDG